MEFEPQWHIIILIRMSKIKEKSDIMKCRQGFGKTWSSIYCWWGFKWQESSLKIPFKTYKGFNIWTVNYIFRHTFQIWRSQQPSVTPCQASLHLRPEGGSLNMNFCYVWSPCNVTFTILYTHLSSGNRCPSHHPLGEICAVNPKECWSLVISRVCLLMN